jgi:tRNA pseudouridine38-40 synthase
VLHIPTPLDAEKMNALAKGFIGRHDFTSFMATGSKITDAVRDVYLSEVKRDGERIIFSVSANGFLYNMVRIMAGTLIDLSLSRLPLDIEKIILEKDRSKAGFTASPEGLYLYRAEY